MNILIACERYGRVREAFRAKGHNAWSCDIEPSKIDGPHLHCPVENVLTLQKKDGSPYFDLLIAHPPCTYVARVSAPHLYNNPERMAKAVKAIEFFEMLKNCPIPKKALENPRPLKLLTDRVGRWTQIVQPYQFGEPYSKATCLWLYDLPPLTPTNIVDRGEFVKGRGGELVLYGIIIEKA